MPAVLLLAFVACASLPARVRQAPLEGGVFPKPICRLDYRYIDADESRRTLVGIDLEHNLFVVRDGIPTRSWSTTALVESGHCGFDREAVNGYRDLGVSSDGTMAWFFCGKGQKAWPTVLTTCACLVDLQTGHSRALEGAFGPSVLLRKEALTGKVAPPTIYIATRRPLVLLIGETTVEVLNARTHDHWTLAIDRALDHRDVAVAEMDGGFRIAGAVAGAAAGGQPVFDAIDIDTRGDAPGILRTRPFHLPGGGFPILRFSNVGSKLGVLFRIERRLAIVDWATLVVTPIAMENPKFEIEAFDFDDEQSRVVVSAYNVDGFESRLAFIRPDSAAQVTFSAESFASRLFVERPGKRFWFLDPNSAWLYAAPTR